MLLDNAVLADMRSKSRRGVREDCGSISVALHNNRSVHRLKAGATGLRLGQRQSAEDSCLWSRRRTRRAGVPWEVPGAATIAVVIPSYNQDALLSRCLRSLELQTRIPDKVVVVDNGGSRPLDLIPGRLPFLHVIRSEHNRGFAAGCNLGVRAAAPCEWVAILNNDAFPAVDWLERILEAVREMPEYSAFASQIVSDEDTSRLHGGDDVYHACGFAWKRDYGRPAARHFEPHEVFSVCGTAAVYRTADYLRVGGYDEDFFCYFEDVDLGVRLQLAGCRSYYLPQARVRHRGSATVGVKSAFSLYFYHRNMVWSFFKNMPAPLLFFYLPQHAIFNVAAVLWYAWTDHGRLILRAKLQALRNVRLFLRKRRFVQGLRTVSLVAMREKLSRGLLRPYLRDRR